MERVINNIRNIEQKISSQTYVSKYTTEDLNFIKYVNKEISNNNMVSATDYLLANIIANESFEVASNYVEPLFKTKLYDNDKYEIKVKTLDQVMAFYNAVLKDNRFETLKNALMAGEKAFIKEVKKKRISKEDKAFYNYAKYLYDKLFYKDYEKMKNFVKTFFEISNLKINYFNLMFEYYSYFNQTEEIKDAVDFRKEADEIANTKLSREEKRIFKNNWVGKLDNIMRKRNAGLRKRFIDFLEEEEKRAKKHKRNMEKNIENCEKLIQILSKYQEDEFIIFNKEIESLCTTSDIRSLIYEYIYFHNEEIVFCLNEEITLLKNRVNTEIINVFIEEGVDINTLGKYHHELLSSSKKPDEIRRIINIFKNNLSTFNLETPKFGNIILNSNEEVINNLMVDLKIGLVDDKFLDNNYEVFVNNEIYNRYKNNISLFNAYGITNLTGRINDIVLLDSNNLDKRLFVSKTYGIDLNNCDTLKFLVNDNFIHNLDTFVELDLIDLIVKYPSNLMIDAKALKRLIIYSTSNVPFRTDERLFAAITSGKNALIKESDLNDYVIDVTTKVDTIYTEVVDKASIDEYFMINEYIYDIDGVIISRKKVLRNLANGMNLYDSILNNSILNTSEVNIIENALTERNIGYYEVKNEGMIRNLNNLTPFGELIAKNK